MFSGDISSYIKNFRKEKLNFIITVVIYQQIVQHMLDLTPKSLSVVKSELHFTTSIYYFKTTF